MKKFIRQNIDHQPIVDNVFKIVSLANEATQGEGSKNTGVIVMNPQNGEILAEASYPNYDLNNPRDLTKYYTEEQLKKMTDQEKLDTLNDLWNNYCVSNTYEPGSTFKPFTISAGLETGVLTGNENYVCALDHWQNMSILLD